ncbi:MAG: hypothetical protein ED556_08130 [Winogradskyella sp.]|uniref:hypothetical protein n=1 Tax=Winogradskyella sp. TaxID=1883156 RepID=UPI000F409043|nr:hypothetical protein [Winogradskyella sp.]RNC86256.1 MAG: hypothetical protein ED556_08130 [Winogradskyella sp.]
MSSVPTYPEVTALKRFIKANNCSAKVLDAPYTIHEFLTPLQLRIGTIDVTIHVQDEYNDLSIGNPLLTIMLCLQELEEIEDSTDYLNWLNFQGIKISTEPLRSYYQNMVTIMPSIRANFTNNTITAFIPGLDYQLNSNSIYYLREKLIT